MRKPFYSCFQRNAPMQFEECHIPGQNTFLNPHFYSVPAIHRVARLSLQSSELAPRAPSSASECCLPFGSGGGTHSPVGRERVEPIRTKGQTLWYSIIPLSSYTKLQYLVSVHLVFCGDAELIARRSAAPQSGVRFPIYTYAASLP